MAKKYAELDSKLGRFIQWLQRIKKGASLPEHLEYKLHNDWPPGLRWVPRELNAFGPRSRAWWASRRRFPMLLIGYNCPRWMDIHDKEVYHCGCDHKLRFFVKEKDCGPSPLQRFGGFSWHFAWPLHFSISLADNDGNCKFLFRIGERWDSLDNYYNIGPYIGLAWN